MGAVRCRVTAARIRSLDAGQGERVPTLDEVLETVRNEAHLLIELKGIGVERATVGAGLQGSRHGGWGARDLFVVCTGTVGGDPARVGQAVRVRAILPKSTNCQLARVRQRSSPSALTCAIRALLFLRVV